MYIFDETDIFYKNPTGPIEVPGTLTLQIRLRRKKARNPRVCFYPDGGLTQSVRMVFDHAIGDYDVYTAKISFDTAALYWYYFMAESDTADSDGGTNKAVGFTVPEQPGEAFQITAYNPEKSWPDWISGGVIYHIFVDRFARGGDVRVRSVGVYREDWGGCPYFLPDEHGIVHNNDFFGGNLYGIIQKLPYLEELGVTCIYLSPVFEADSNHKYDTGDFLKVDEAFGGDGALSDLCKQAKKRKIRVILDGVFNHVGSNSVYFDRYGRYGSSGAFTDRANSPYSDWFTFRENGKYDAWWGIELLPAISKDSSGYRDFICGKDGVISKWMARGVSGWRLDVVDELPDMFLDPLCEAMKRERSDVFIAGEVWEDASHKIAYGERRRYFLGGQLHSVTNYPLRDAIICCVKDGDVYKMAAVMASLCKNYPKKTLDSLLNIIGTHDTMRILTALSDAKTPDDKPAMSRFKLDPQELKTAKDRLLLASSLQFTLPGVPCVYYGDEAGMEGCIDPFNRYCYPWGSEDTELISWYKRLSALRREQDCFKNGAYTLIEARDGLFAFTRGTGEERVLVAVNVSATDITMTAAAAAGFSTELLRSGSHCASGNDKDKKHGSSGALYIRSNEVGIFK